MPPTDLRQVIADLATAVQPLDNDEAQDRKTILEWIASEAPLFRTDPPDVPPMHLAVYVALYDETRHAVLLVNHIKAGLWLLPGGHVDPGEDPRVTVVREAHEELGLDIRLHEGTNGRPVFLSVTATRGPHTHTDVTMWFLANGDRTAAITPDPGEFHGVHWFGVAGTDWDVDRFDPNMARFVRKMAALVDARTGQASAAGRPA
jgi:8-oxo-dGTP diphosphatase